MTMVATPAQRKALVAGCSRHEGEDQKPNHHEGASAMSSVTEATTNSNPTPSPLCSYAWCEVDHAEAPGLHMREWISGRVRLDFVLEDSTGQTSISWVDMFDLSFMLDQLDGVNDIAAALIAGRAEFEVFAAEVAR